MIHQFAAAMQAEMQREITNQTELLAQGRCKTYDEYKNMCGKIQGLAFAMNTTKVLLERVEHDE